MAIESRSGAAVISTAEQVARETEVGRQMVELSAAIEEADKNAHALCARLSIVQRPENPATASDAKMPREVLCSFAEDIYRLRKSVEEMAAFLSDNLGRLEL